MLAGDLTRSPPLLGAASTFSQIPYEPCADDSDTTTPSPDTTTPHLALRFLEKRRPTFRPKKVTSPTPITHSLSPRHSSQDTLRPDSISVSANDAASILPRPRHVPIVIPQDLWSSPAWHARPPSPASSDSNSNPTSHRASFAATWTFESDRAEHGLTQHTSRGARHIPIQIPAFAHPFGHFPPTPSASADNTPRGSISKSVHSCEHDLLEMSSRSLRSDDSASAGATALSPSPSQSPNAAFEDAARRPSTVVDLPNLLSSSEASLVNPVDPSASLRVTDSPPKLQHHPQFSESGPQHAAPTSAPTNLDPNAPSSSQQSLTGLVCTVHQCTGRELHGLVGATTTILGDMLYVFGGRCLSKRKPYLTADLYELDLITRHWTKVTVTGDVPAPRYFHSVCTLGHTKLVCYGGMSPAASQQQDNATRTKADPNGEMVVMSDIHIYDVLTRSWTYIPTAETPPGRYAHCAAILPTSASLASHIDPMAALQPEVSAQSHGQGTLGIISDGLGGAEMIVVGGQDCNNKYIDAISVFNLRSLKWTDTQPLPRSCGAYRSVVTPLTGMAPSKIGADLDRKDSHSRTRSNATSTTTDSAASMLIYSNYNFLDVKLELQVRQADGSLIEKPMQVAVSPPGLRFPNGDVLDHHFIVSGTYLTSSKHEYALWALDLRTLTWSRIDAGGGIFSQGSWNRGILWPRRNKFVILGNRKRSLVDDYNHRRVNFANICIVDLEAFGLYNSPRESFPASNYKSCSAPVISASDGGHGSRIATIAKPLPTAAMDLGYMAMHVRDLADMELMAINGERIPVNSRVLAKRWGPFFVKMLKETNGFVGSNANDASSSSNGDTLRANSLNTADSTSRNSSVTITPSFSSSTSTTASSVTAVADSDNDSGNTASDAPTPRNLPAPSRPRQLYLPHMVLTIRAMLHYIYTMSLPPPNHSLCTPQILCSLLQIARPYRIDGLLEATVERLHQILDGRNAAAIFNAAAMAAGGGRACHMPFGDEIDPSSSRSDGGESLLVPRVKDLSLAHHGQKKDRRVSNEINSGNENESGDSNDTGSDTSSHPPGSASASVSGSSESNARITTSPSLSSSSAASTSASAPHQTSGSPKHHKSSKSMDNDQIWTGGISSVVGLQKRGLRGLMEGRRIRERERGHARGRSVGASGEASGMNNGERGGESSSAGGVGNGSSE